METKQAVWNALRTKLEKFVAMQENSATDLRDLETLRREIELLETALADFGRKVA